MLGDLQLLASPQTDLSAVPRSYVDAVRNQLGNYLPLSGGLMEGGIRFDDGFAGTNSNTDTSKYITLYSSGFGFGISPARLNYNVDSTSNHVFLVGGVDKMFIDTNGMHMRSGDLYLPNIPTSGTMATNKDYVDSRTPIVADAPNDTYWYGRHSGAWAEILGYSHIGAGAYDLNAVPFGFAGILQITNQASAPNWPSDNADQTAAVLHTWNSNQGWNGQLMMGGRQRGPQPALWYRSQDDAYGSQAWSPWTRLIGSTGGTFDGPVMFAKPVNYWTGDQLGAVPITIQANGNYQVPANLWGAGLSFNLSGGGSELDFINLFNGAGTSFAWWQVDSATAMRSLMWLLPNGDLHVSGAVYLPGDPTANNQAANKQYTDGVIARAGGPFLPIIGGTLSGNLGLNGAWPTITLDTVSGEARQIMGATGGSPRWLIRLGDNTSEAGNNTGSDFNLWRYADNGSDAWMAFYIYRQTGDAQFWGTIVVGNDPTQPLAVATKQYVDSVRTLVTGSYLPLVGGTLSGLLTAQAGITVTGGQLSANNYIWAGTQTGSGIGIVVQSAPATAPGYNWFTTQRRWLLALDQYPENGGNNGGNLAFYRYDDAGNFLGTSFSLNRADGSAWFGGVVMLAQDPTSNLGASTKQYVDAVRSFVTSNYLPLVGGQLTGPVTSRWTADPSTAQLFLGPDWSYSQEGKLRFGGTFPSSSGDGGTRLTASLRSGFVPTSAWGGEYLDVWINNGVPNDAGSDVNQVQVARFTRFGIQMPAGMAITLANDPSTGLQASTKQYVRSD